MDLELIFEVLPKKNQLKELASLNVLTLQMKF